MKLCHVSLSLTTPHMFLLHPNAQSNSYNFLSSQPSQAFVFLPIFHLSSSFLFNPNHITPKSPSHRVSVSHFSLQQFPFRRQSFLPLSGSYPTSLCEKVHISRLQLNLSLYRTQIKTLESITVNQSHLSSSELVIFLLGLHYIILILHYRKEDHVGGLTKIGVKCPRNAYTHFYEDKCKEIKETDPNATIIKVAGTSRRSFGVIESAPLPTVDFNSKL